MKVQNAVSDLAGNKNPNVSVSPLFVHEKELQRASLYVSPALHSLWQRGKKSDRVVLSKG